MLTSFPPSSGRTDCPLRTQQVATHGRPCQGENQATSIKTLPTAAPDRRVGLGSLLERMSVQWQPRVFSHRERARSHSCRDG
jgi:hypothetical protein